MRITLVFVALCPIAALGATSSSGPEATIGLSASSGTAPTLASNTPSSRDRWAYSTCIPSASPLPPNDPEPTPKSGITRVYTLGRSYTTTTGSARPARPTKVLTAVKVAAKADGKAVTMRATFQGQDSPFLPRSPWQPPDMSHDYGDVRLAGICPRADR